MIKELFYCFFFKDLLTIKYLPQESSSFQKYIIKNDSTLEGVFVIKKHYRIRLLLPKQLLPFLRDVQHVHQFVILVGAPSVL